MHCGRLITSMALAAALIVANAAASAHDESKYPDWSGQWRRPQGLGIQWDPSKKLGRDEAAPLTPEYQKIFEAGLADQAAGGQGNDPTYLHSARHAARDDGGVPDGDRDPAARHLHPAGIRPHDPPHLHRRTQHSRTTRSRRSSATRSASGSIPTATASSTRSKSRPATSRARAPSTPAASRCTRTTRPSSRSASISTRPTRTCCATRSPRSTTRSRGRGR